MFVDIDFRRSANVKRKSEGNVNKPSRSGQRSSGAELARASNRKVLPYKTALSLSTDHT